MYCGHCKVMMVHVMSFSKEANQEFYRCPRCWSETSRIPLKFSPEEITPKNYCDTNTPKKRRRGS